MGLSEPPVTQMGGSGWPLPAQGPQQGLLTGLGGSLWLRALWTLPISVCELEWDRPSKYGLGNGDRECVVLHTPPPGPSRVEHRAGPTLKDHSIGGDTAGLRAAQHTCAPKPPNPGGRPGHPR